MVTLEHHREVAPLARRTTKDSQLRKVLINLGSGCKQTNALYKRKCSAPKDDNHLRRQDHAININQDIETHINHTINDTLSPHIPSHASQLHRIFANPTTRGRAIASTSYPLTWGLILWFTIENPPQVPITKMFNSYVRITRDWCGETYIVDRAACSSIDAFKTPTEITQPSPFPEMQQRKKWPGDQQEMKHGSISADC